MSTVLAKVKKTTKKLKTQLEAKCSRLAILSSWISVRSCSNKLRSLREP